MELLTIEPDAEIRTRRRTVSPETRANISEAMRAVAKARHFKTNELTADMGELAKLVVEAAAVIERRKAIVARIRELRTKLDTVLNAALADS
jgi:hypothetical protein